MIWFWTNVIHYDLYLQAFLFFTYPIANKYTQNWTYRFTNEFKCMNQNFECFFCSWLRVFVWMNKYCLAFVVFLNIVITTCVRNSKNAAKLFSYKTFKVRFLDEQTKFILEYNNLTCPCACDYNYSIQRSDQRDLKFYTPMHITEMVFYSLFVQITLNRI